MSTSHKSRLAGGDDWVDPYALPNHGNVADIAGNASDQVKQLTNNVLWSYGAGQEDGFAYDVCRRLKILEVNLEEIQNRVTATVIHEIEVFEGMLNGAGAVHGGCFCTLVDLCASTPLVALGLIQETNGVGVSQGMTITFHAPSKIGDCLRLVGTSIVLNKRIMSARCEATDKASGRVLVSAMLTKVQPRL